MISTIFQSINANPVLPVRPTAIVMTVSGALLALSACATQSISLEEAKEITASFQSGTFAPPPKTTTDIAKLLDEHKLMDPAIAKSIAEFRAAAMRKVPDELSGMELAEFLFKRGIAAGRSGQVGRALKDLRRAEKLSRSRFGETRREILWELAGAETLGGSPKDAVRFREEAVMLHLGPSRSIGYNAILAMQQANVGNFGAAERSLENAKQFSDIASMANSSWKDFADNATYAMLWAEGTVEMRKGRYREAEQLLRSALKTALAATTRTIRDVGNRISIRGSLAGVLAKQGRNIESEVENRRAVREAVARFGRYSQHTGVRLASLAGNIIEQGRYREGQQLAKAALDIHAKLGFAEDSYFYTSTRIRIADLSVLQGRWAEALRQYDDIDRSIDRNAFIRSRLLSSNLNRVVALYKAGRVVEADRTIKKILGSRMEQLGPEHYETAEAFGLSGMIRAALGEKDAALEQFRRAIPVLLASSHLSDRETESNASRELRLKLVLDSYIALLAERASARTDERTKAASTSEAFRIADIARSRSVHAALAASGVRAAAGDHTLADLIRREQDASKRISALYGIYANALSASPGQQHGKVQAALRSEIDKVRNARESLAEEIAKRFPEYADLVNPNPPTIQDVQRTLRAGESVIVAYVTDTSTFVWGVPKNGEVVFAVAPLGKARLGQMVRKLRRALDPRVATIGDIPAFDVQVSYELYKALLAPVEESWKNANTLLVVVNGPLGQLPMSVLVTEPADLPREQKPLFSNYRQIQWLARTHGVTVLPSVASLTTLRKSPLSGTNRRNFVGFGDPWFSDTRAGRAETNIEDGKKGAVPASSLGPRAERRLPASLRASPQLDGVSSADLGKLPRLPDTAAEVRDIGIALNADLTRDVFTGIRASERQVKQMDLSRYRVVAFATHGLNPGDLDGLTQPALALSSPKVTGDREDGLLTMSEVLGLKLNADWVVLSACNTASGQGKGAEAISGLGRAFFYAGTRALLATYWPVETTSARALTTNLFERQATNPGQTRSEALRKTMLSLIDGKGLSDRQGRTVFSYAHPVFWAPFSLIGDGAGGLPAT